MGLFFYTKIGSIISIGDLPTTNIIEPNSFTFPNRLGFILFQSIIVLGNFFKPHQLGQFYLRPQNLCFGQAGFSFLVC
ncbi:DNA polymerase IV [Streptococcus pneumoniae]|nr:DNA polymerase IV [Streptococcus pneumoniae]